MSHDYPGADRLPIDVSRQIDSLCDEFEGQLVTEGALNFAAYADRIDTIGRRRLLVELTGLAIGWLREEGHTDPSTRLLAANPETRDEIMSLLSEVEVTVSHTPRTAAGSGLHVRCPHCHNPIELVPDASLENIRCDSCGSDFSLIDDGQATHTAEAITEVAHFKLVNRVGMGAFGSVFKAYDTKLHRTVAVKIPRRGQFDEKQERAFIREAQNVAQLNHPNIVTVYEVGRDGDTLYIVNEFIRGLTLADWLTGQRLTPREAAELTIKIADALQHAHDRGVIHRDLKPGNIMLDDRGEPHLMDFGLAKRDAGEITMSLNGQIIGTPAYMSPEQAKGEGNEADARSDVYSLGVILFQLLTNELPFRGNARMLVYQVINDEPPTPRKLNSSVHRDLETIVLKCLDKSPKLRYQSAISVRNELSAWLEGKPIDARPVGIPQRLWRWSKRNPLHLAIVCFLLATSSIAVATAFQERELRKSQQALVEYIERSLGTGDFNKDGKVDFDDVARFAEVLEDGGESKASDVITHMKNMDVTGRITSPRLFGIATAALLAAIGVASLVQAARKQGLPNA